MTFWQWMGKDDNWIIVGILSGVIIMTIASVWGASQ